MILEAASEHFGLDSNWRMESLLPGPINLDIEPANTDLAFWQQLFCRHHDIRHDHDALTQSTHMSDLEFALYFDSLRRVYPERFEYERYRLTAEVNKKAATTLRKLHFQIL